MSLESALKSLGYKNVRNVRIGKYIELELTTQQPNHLGPSSVEGPATKKQIEEMCNKLLANPIIEDYHFEVAEE